MWDKKQRSKRAQVPQYEVKREVSRPLCGVRGEQNEKVPHQHWRNMRGWEGWGGKIEEREQIHILSPFSKKKLARSSEERKMGAEGGCDKWVEEIRSYDFRCGNQLICWNWFILARKMLVLTEECNKFVRK